MASGLTLGPQDVDSAGDLTGGRGNVGVHNHAKTLLKRHAQLYPVELRTALARPRDPERSTTLDVEEVEQALGSLQGRRAFFDPEEHVLEDASVKGSNEGDRVVAVVFRSKRTGRSARGVFPYDGLSKSQRAYARVMSGEPGNAGGQVPSEEPADTEAAEGRAREAEGRVAALEERLARLENPEPWDGYDEADADAVASRVSEGGYVEFGKAGLERIESYEKANKNRKTVLRAVDAALAEVPSV